MDRNNFKKVFDCLFIYLGYCFSFLIKLTRIFQKMNAVYIGWRIRNFKEWRLSNKFNGKIRLLGGACIGDCAIIGANAVVTKDVLPYSIAVGNPARIISYFEQP